VYDPDSSWWLFTLRVSDRDDFIRYLGEHGIMASPVHSRNDRHTAFLQAVPDRMRGMTLPGVDVFASQEVAIPVGWWLTEADRQQIVQTIRDWPSP
jgi:perosamine synthetase